MALPGGFDPGRLGLSSPPGWLFSPDPNGTTPGQDDHGLLSDGAPEPVISWCLLAAWLVPVLVYYLWDNSRKQVTREIDVGGEAGTVAPEAREPTLGCSVMLASIEHSTPWTEALPEGARTQKVQAGGLGVVVRLITERHPRGDEDNQLWLVHPMVSGNGIDYGDGEREPDLRVRVDGRTERIQVFRHEHPRDGLRVKYLLLHHRLFTERTWKKDPPELYPAPMTRTKVLCFYALWNQAVGALLRRYKPAVYHCPDFHAALASWHAVAPGTDSHPRLKVLLVLHNAEYQGSISTDMALGEKAGRLAQIFDVPQDFFERHMVHDGRLNMLKAAVDFCSERQRGQGVCAVSDHYAEEVEQQYDLFWCLPPGAVRGLPNPMLDEDRARVPLGQSAKQPARREGLPPGVFERLRSGETPELSSLDLAALLPRLTGKGQAADVADVQDVRAQEDLEAAATPRTSWLLGLPEDPQAADFVWLHRHLDCLQDVKAVAKAKMQRLLGLREDPQARMFVSLGRIVRQKGVDLIAEVARWLLETYEDAQLVIIGPDEDGFGAFARTRLEALQESFRDRMFCYFQFWRAPQALKLAADFCLMPSRDEPFGYVDVEFAWNGAVVVGAQVGGLGKVPGFYYVAQNRESLKHLQSELQTVLARAMEVSHEDPERIARMSQQAVLCRFPLGLWQRRMLERYYELSALPPPPAEATERPRAGTVELLEAVPAASSSSPAAPPRPAADGAAAPEAAAAAAPTAADWGDDSWLLQELSELELKERIVARLAEAEERIDEILEVVGTDEDRKRERLRSESGQGHWLSEWLLGSTWGVHRVHWVVACGFIFLPIGQSLAWVIATEWGVRSTGLPSWVPKISGPVDPAMVSFTLFMACAAPQAACAILWARSCRFHRAKSLLSGAMLLNLVFVLPFFFSPRPNFFAAVLLMSFAGTVASASMLFVVFNFMMSIRADVSQAALRMGRLEIARSFIQWMLQAFILFASPSSILGTKEDPMTYDVMVSIMPIGVLALVCSAVPGILALYAPRPYRDDRFPGSRFTLFMRKPSFVLLTLSDCVGGLAAFPSSCYLNWWLANGHTPIALGWDSLGIAVVFSACIGLWAFALSTASVHGFSLLIGVVVFLAPPCLLRAVAMEEVSTLNFLGASQSTIVLTTLTVVFEGVRSSALWAAKIRILGSRWRLLSWGSLSIALQQGCTFISPLFCELLARQRNNSTFLTRNQKELADAMIVSIVPLGCLQYLLQLLSIIFIHKDLGLSRLRGISGFFHRRFAKRSPVAAAGGIALAVIFATVVAMHVLQATPLPYNPVQRCYNVSEVATGPPCAVLFESQNGAEFSLNSYGQPTTARKRCLQRMRLAGGDTFELVVGERCKVMECKSFKTLAAAGKSFSGAEVFSRHCEIYGQNLVVVHLFEWSWNDVAQECQDYLGPAGFDGVQVSPPTEHINGNYWYTRYQPVSYSLDSRGGTESEFINMVKQCKDAGVAVLVDAVVNHMASPFVVWPEDQVGKECDGQGEKYAECFGWSGTRFGSRLFEHGDVHYKREDFHHYQGNSLSNCVIPPFYNNRHICDLTALPDLDTEQFQVQDKLRAYLGRLYELGVTMLRIDAAMCLYPASLGQLLQDFPLDYVYQEYYADLFYLERHTMRDALDISPVTDFNYGWEMADILFDYVEDGEWVSKEEDFDQLLNMGKQGSQYADGVLPATRGLRFLDNHDQQRERWKPEYLSAGTPNATCRWDGKNIKPCRPIYKHGLMYNLAQLFTLAWPRGDSVQLMSSYAWKHFEAGPPGTDVKLQRGGLPERVWKDGKLVGCRVRPSTSPVDDTYDNDTERPWVCEHRWEGVAGLIRLRKSFGKGGEVPPVVNAYGKGPHVAFSLGDLAFVALHRGYNWDTGLGSNRTWNLTGVPTGLPPGRYCDLARESRPVPPATGGGQQVLTCSWVVTIGPKGQVSTGFVTSGGVLAVHKDYLASPTYSSVVV